MFLRLSASKYIATEAKFASQKAKKNVLYKVQRFLVSIYMFTTRDTLFSQLDMCNVS